MGKAYRISGDEKYAKGVGTSIYGLGSENPLVNMKQEEFELVSAGEVKGRCRQCIFAWRQLEVSNRLQDETCQFLCFVPHRRLLRSSDRVYRQLSPPWRTSPENYSAEGNHLLFEAQRMVYAGVFFPN